MCIPWKNFHACKHTWRSTHWNVDFVAVKVSQILDNVISKVLEVWVIQDLLRLWVRQAGKSDVSSSFGFLTRYSQTCVEVLKGTSSSPDWESKAHSVGLKAPLFVQVLLRLLQVFKDKVHKQVVHLSVQNLLLYTHNC